MNWDLPAFVTTALIAFTPNVNAADNKPPEKTACMTREQARAAYPKQWLYWHGANRCWDNKPGARRQARQMHAAVVSRERSEPKSEFSPPKPTAAPPPQSPTIIWPTVTVTPVPLVREMLLGNEMTGWPLLLDIDQITGAPPPVFEGDYCCWPQLDKR